MTPADPILDLALLVPRTEAEGPGLRCALWVQGCPLRCPGCCNPELLAFSTPTAPRGTARSVRDVLAEIPADVEGVSFLGGEPTAHAEPLAWIARAVRARGQSVMIFSGYTLAELRARSDAHVTDLLAHTDLLVDGRYDETRRTTARRWVGSENQVMHFLTDRYRADDPRFTAPNSLELRITIGSKTRELTVNGFPVRGART